MVSPVQPQATSPIRPPLHAQLPPPMVPTLPPPMVPTLPLPMVPTTAAPQQPQPGLASPKPPPRSRSSHGLPAEAAPSPAPSPASQVSPVLYIMQFARLCHNKRLIVAGDSFLQHLRILAESRYRCACKPVGRIDHREERKSTQLFLKNGEHGFPRVF